MTDDGETVYHGYYRIFDRNSTNLRMEETYNHGELKKKVFYYFSNREEVFFYEMGKITDEDIWKDGECFLLCEGDEEDE